MIMVKVRVKVMVSDRVIVSLCLWFRLKLGLG